MPTPSPPAGSTGYVYWEGFPAANYADPGEGGLIYSAVHNWYTPYTMTDTSGTGVNPLWIGTSNYLGDGQTLNFQISDSFVNIGGTLYPALNLLVTGYDVSTGSTFTDANTAPAVGFSVPNCCIWARMTTIAQKPNDFNLGIQFGNIGWTQAQLTYCSMPAPNSCYQTTTTSWLPGGEQSWPNDTSRIIVNKIDWANETDTIYLHL
jgi:hypothetical protein